MALLVYPVSYVMGRNHLVPVKIAISLDGAFMGYKQARLNKSYQKGDGLVAHSVDDTIKKYRCRSTRHERNWCGYFEWNVEALIVSIYGVYFVIENKKNSVMIGLVITLFF